MFSPNPTNRSLSSKAVYIDRRDLQNSSALASVAETSHYMLSPTTSVRTNFVGEHDHDGREPPPPPPSLLERHQQQHQQENQQEHEQHHQQPSTDKLTTMPTIYGSRTFRDDFDLKPLSVNNNSNVPMLMLMDHAQSSAIDSLHRQLAEERERSSHRIQTEVLMSQLLDERKTNEAKLNDAEEKYNLGASANALEYKKNLDNQQMSVDNAMRRFNMEKRANEVLRKQLESADEKNKKQVQQLQADLTSLNEALATERQNSEKKLKYAKDELERERVLHEQIRAEKEAQTGNLLKELKKAFAAEQETVSSQLKNAEDNYANKVKIFEMEVVKLMESTAAAKMASEAALNRQRKEFEEKFNSQDSAISLLKKEILRRKFSSAFARNGFEKKLKERTNEEDRIVARLKESATFELEKARRAYDERLAESASELKNVHDKYETVVRDLNGDIHAMQTNHSATIIKVSEDNKKQLTAEITSLTEQFQEKFVKGLSKAMEERDTLVDELKARLETKHKNEINVLVQKNRDEGSFMKSKILELENRVEGLHKEKSQAENGHVEMASKFEKEKLEGEKRLEEAKKNLQDSKKLLEEAEGKLAVEKELLAEMKCLNEKNTGELGRALENKEREAEENKINLVNLRSELDRVKSDYEHRVLDLVSELDSVKSADKETNEKNQKRIEFLENEIEAIKSADDILVTDKNDTIAKLTNQVKKEKELLKEEVLAEKDIVKILNEKHGAEIEKLLLTIEEGKKALTSMKEGKEKLEEEHNRALKEKTRKHNSDLDSKILDRMGSKITKADIRHIVTYIDSMGNNDKEISIEELENVIRNCRRGKGAGKEHARGRLLMYRLREAIEKRGWSIKDWFKDCLTIGNVGERDEDYHDGRVSMTKIHHELESVCEGTDCDVFDQESIEHIIHYLDPHFHGFITMLEVKDAFRRSTLTPDSLLVEYNCSLVMSKLEEWMLERKLRVVDLFRKLDSDRSGFINREEFQSGVESFVGLTKNVEEVLVSAMMVETDPAVIQELSDNSMVKRLVKGGSEQGNEQGDEDDDDENKSESDDDEIYMLGGDAGGADTSRVTRRLKKANSVI